MRSHGLDGWIFRWDGGKRRYGCCRYSRKAITISKYLAALNPIQKTIDTVKHEIAHALCPGQHHNHVWKRKAVEIGCSPERCYNETVIAPKAAFKLSCSNCTNVSFRHRRSRRNLACVNCCGIHNGGRYDARFILKWSRNV